jgi:hypothetical protein
MFVLGGSFGKEQLGTALLKPTIVHRAVVLVN